MELHTKKKKGEWARDGAIESCRWRNSKKPCWLARSRKKPIGSFIFSNFLTGVGKTELAKHWQLLVR